MTTMADVLIVEDDHDAADALVAILRMSGHVVRHAFDGQDGLRLLHERLPDLIVLDVEMPILDGPGMAAAMLVHDAGLETVPIVLLSGVPELRELAERIGTPYFLSKPCTLAALEAMVRRALTDRVPPQPVTTGRD
jgi:DNA-binding response OmpR family regulator